MKFRGMLGNWSCGRMTETPEDIATLYSHARMQWARYWDFSASRRQVRQQLGIMREPLEWPSTSPPMPEFPAIPFRANQMTCPPKSIFRKSPSKVPNPNLSRHPRYRRLKWSLRQPASPRGARKPSRCRQSSRVPQNTPVAATRWYALRSIFAPAQAPLDPSSFPAFEQRPPIVVVFSLAGGVGKTCLVPPWACSLPLGEHVLLAETATCGILPFYSARAN